VIFCTDQFDLYQHLSDLKRKWQVVAESLATQQDRLGHLSGEAAERARRQVAQLSLESQHLTTRLRQPDALLSFDTALGDVSPCGFPVFHCRRSAIDKLLRQSLGSDLSQLERRLDAEFRPQSTELPGWRVRGQADLQRRPTTIRNVVAALEPRKSDDLYASTETIVVGAHYDHLGYGGVGSLATGDRRVHPGADDNASGVAVLLEVAHRLVTAGPLPRRVLFIAFGGEESGLLGSMYYVKHPPVPLDSTVAMINFDMVGRMTDQRVMVLGCGSCAAFRPLLDAANAERGLQLVTMPLGVTPSDQLPFIGQQIPSLHLFTGMHGDYHRPGDEFGKLNVEGMRQIALLAADVITGLANLSKVPQFTVAAVADARGHQRAFLGGIPAEGSDGTGCRLMSVVPGGPAYRAGVQPGDVIVQLDNRPVTKLEDLLAALQHCREGQRVNLTVRRGPRLLTLEVTLSAGP